MDMDTYSMCGSLDFQVKTVLGAGALVAADAALGRRASWGSWWVAR